MQFSQREHDLADLAGFERSGSKAKTSVHPIIIVGLAFEARLVVGAGTVLCSGDGHDLQPSLARAIMKDCCGLISFGVAGGLAPNLSPGTCIVGSEILSGTAWLLTDHDWSQNLLQVIPNAIYGKIVGVSAPIPPKAKHALHLNMGAVAIDMESHIVARIAAENNLPFAAIRVITNPVERPLPQVVWTTMRPNGTIDIGSLFYSLMKRPAEVGALARTAYDALAAYARLRHVCRALRRVRWTDAVDVDSAGGRTVIQQPSSTVIP